MPSPSKSDTASPRKILIVEDDAGLRNVHNIFFGMKNFDVSMVTEGRLAIEHVRKSEPDIVVLDLGLPDIDGLEVLKAIRQFSSVPIIVMTARTDIQSINQTKALGADDYINKPFRPEILLHRIDLLTRQTT
jgi:two-component system KDP operon response regulator KdpE